MTSLDRNAITMTHLEDHIDTVQKILNDLCTTGDPVTKSDIYDVFSKMVKSDIEKYRFSKEISELIRRGKINGFSIRVGRNGGIVKNQEPLKVRLTYPTGEVAGDIEPAMLPRLIALIRSTNK